ncbi:MAG: hypothetical protein CTY19_09010 [Methylomonas sp.]|jgi:chromosome segregation ATPase|nr:MAG: hypothetical protein CTY19_09010 [Methylomonas sp.]
MKSLLKSHEKEIEKLIESIVAHAKEDWLIDTRKLEQQIADAANREAALIEENSDLKQKLKEARSYKDYYSKLLDDAKEIELELHRKCADYHVRQQELEESLKANNQAINSEGVKDAKIDLIRLTNQIHAARTELSSLRKEIEQVKA